MGMEEHVDSAASRPPLALIANDKEWSGRSIESILVPGGYAILRAHTGRQTIETARSAQPDLIIVDAQLPDLSGLDVCRSLRDDPEISSTVPILVTAAGPVRRSQRLEALAAGAWEFVPLPLDAEELLLKLGVYTKAKLSADGLRDESLIDQTTGLYNWRGLMRRARELGSDAYRHERALACLAVAPELRSLDGRPLEAADVLVKAAVDQLAHVLRESGRVSDAIGRVRPSEFVVIAPDTDAVKAHRLAERLTRVAEAAQLQIGVEAPIDLLVGYDAVGNFRAASIEPTALLAGATTALRGLQADSKGDVIRRFAAGHLSVRPVD